MTFVENMYESIALKLNGTTKVEYHDHTIDLKAPWKRLSMKKAIKEYSLQMQAERYLELYNDILKMG